MYVYIGMKKKMILVIGIKIILAIGRKNSDDRNFKKLKKKSNQSINFCILATCIYVLLYMYYCTYKVREERKAKVRKRVSNRRYLEYCAFINYRSVGNNVEFTDVIVFQVELYNNHVNHIIDIL